MQDEKFELAEELQKNDLITEVLSIIDLDPLTREQERSRIAKKYDVRKSIIDKYIKEIPYQEYAGETSGIVTEVEPSKERINGNELLSSIKGELLKYVLLPGGVAEPIAAWTVLTYCYDAFRILPLLGIVSPVKRCGKTTLLEILQGLTNKALTASNISPAATYRTIEMYSPTLLVDEADSFLKDNNELRGILNSGHTRSSAFVLRVHGDSHEPIKFSTWGPKAMSMIGTLPDTLQDRAVTVSLRRKAPGEIVSKIGVGFAIECQEIRRACRRWANDNMDILKTTKPSIPITNNDRLSDNWMPLLAIADVAGGEWPELMRKSMFRMIDVTDESIGPKLLHDIQDVFKSHMGERIFSDDLVTALTDKKESPWCDWNRGRGLNQNGLARLLKPFSIKSKTMRIGENLKKGYMMDSFNDAFIRYIPPTPPVLSETPLQSNDNNELDVNQSVTYKNDVTDEKQGNLLILNNCYTVTDKKGGSGEGTKDIPQWKQLRFESEEDYLKMIG